MNRRIDLKAFGLGFPLPWLFLFLGGLPSSAQMPGEEIWRFTTGELIFSSPAVGEDGTIYIGSEDNKLYAVNPDGTQKWVFTGATDWIDSSPTIAKDGTIYVGSWDNHLYALNPSNGAEIWNFEAGSLVIASPALDSEGTIYFGSSDATFYALNPEDGTLKWQFLLEDQLDSSPAIGADGTIYVGSYDGKLYALNPDGTLQWSFAVETVPGEDSRIISSPAIDPDGNLYFGSGNNKLYSLAPDGTQRWTFATDGKVDTSPALGIDGMVYFASRDGFLYALDELGVEDWSVLVGDVFFSSPVVDAAGNITIASFAGQGRSKVFTFTADGEFLWEFTLNNLIDSSPTIAPNGVIYIGAYDHNLYALEGGNALANSFWPQFSHDSFHTSLSFEKELPIISWSNPADIAAGTELSGMQLDAAANISGTFDYDPPLGTILEAGAAQTLSATFTPDDTDTYRTVMVEVLLNVAASDVFGGVLLGDNFFFSDWYGIYNVTFYPWVFHIQHGFQFVFETENPGEVFLFDLESQDFWWTTSAFTDIFFTFYSFNRGTFNFYFAETVNPRSFVDLETEEFYTIPSP